MLQDVSDMFVAPRRRRSSLTEVARPAETAEAAAQRRRREDDFEMFRSHAAEFFDAPPSDDRHERMIARAGYYYALGVDAAQTDDAEDADESAKPAERGLRGLNPRVVEVFYGARQLDAFADISAPHARETWENAAETGAALIYVQGDDGAVTALLYPAAIPHQKAEEDAIILAEFRETEALTGRGLLEAHWREFRAYAEVTSLDGEPTWADKLRVAWLRLSRPRVIDGRRRSRALRDLAVQNAGFALAVVLAAMFLG